MGGSCPVLLRDGRAVLPAAQAVASETRRRASPPFRSLPPGLASAGKAGAREWEGDSTAPSQTLPQESVAPAKPALEHSIDVAFLRRRPTINVGRDSIAEGCDGGGQDPGTGGRAHLDRGRAVRGDGAVLPRPARAHSADLEARLHQLRV